MPSEGFGSMLLTANDIPITAREQAYLKTKSHSCLARDSGADPTRDRMLHWFKSVM